MLPQWIYGSNPTGSIARGYCGNISPMKRRKPRAERKEESIRIRVSADQKRALTEAATRVGLDVSSWLRSLGLAQATAGTPEAGSAHQPPGRAQPP